MIALGITGRSGCGKSTVTAVFSAHGVPLADADQISREILLPGSPLLPRLAQRFGADILKADGTLDRRLLADRAFATPEGKAALDSLTHPEIVRRIRAAKQAAQDAGAPLFVLDGAVIVGTAAQAECDRLCVVTAPFETSVARIVARDGCPPPERPDTGKHPHRAGRLCAAQRFQPCTSAGCGRAALHKASGRRRCGKRTLNKRYNEQDPAPQYDPETARIRRALRAQKARRRKKMRSRRLFLLGMALILLFVLVPNWSGRAERLLYPRKYEVLVDQWAETYGLDPLLVDAFIRTESGFDPQATSTVDARGLMQMTEETFIWLRSKIAPDEGLLFANLYDPETSIRFGCYYLHLCMERYNGDVATVAAAYHSGWGTVDALLQMEEHSADGETLQGFPYNQMNHYVKKITSCYARYQRIYAES